MEKVKNIIIGFGKAGKTLAQEFNTRQEKTIVVEKDPKMYGGTCINVACIPSKKLALLAQEKPEDVDDKAYYKTAVQEKSELISRLNETNYHNVQENEFVEVIDGLATFVSEDLVKISFNDGGQEIYEAERIIINTGSRPNIPDIEGLTIDGEKIHTSETLMEDEDLPDHLTILGDGYIGLEFASMFTLFGSKVTVLSHNSEADFLENEDVDVAETVLETLRNLDIEFIFNAKLNHVEKNEQQLDLSYEQNNEVVSIQTDKLLVAVGRHANLADLNLDSAGVYVAENETIQVNKHLETNIENIFAVGDVNGGPQHTYLSLDDYRIVKSELFEDGSYTLAERENVPNTTFIYPPLSTVGLTERRAKEEGYKVKISTLTVSQIPKAKIFNHPVGLYKAVIDVKTNRLLGAALFAEDSHEVINILSLAIKAELTAKDLANQIFTHPSMAEALNDLFKEFE